MLNPSKIITDVLSKYLEFDPEQLKLGIWSGKLSMKEVELKREAIYPLLNGKGNVEDGGRTPLKLKLVKGTVGHMRIRIPWKRLVWGQGDVKLQISDVTIALAFESREETAARRLPKEQEIKAQEEEDTEEDEEETKRKRDAKQEWLRKAERCQLMGLPLPSTEDIDKKTEEKANFEDGESSGASSKGRVDSWLKSATESFAWRFVAGLDASIRNVRVVIVQDGVEIGTIFHSMDVVPKTLDRKDNREEEQEDTDPSAEELPDPSVATPPPDVVPEGEFEDGEHLDKDIKLQGFGIFVRPEDKRGKSPKTLQFSSSVSADDYILRPTESTLTISIFDPYPAGKKKKKKPPTIEEEPTTPTTATATVDSVTSSKSRRSKREKRPLLTAEAQDETVPVDPGSPSGDSERPTKQLRPALKRPAHISSSTRHFSISETPTSIPANRPKSHTVDLSGGASAGIGKSSVPRANLNRVTSAGTQSRASNSSVAARSIPLLPTDDTSTMETPAVRGPTGTLPPSLDVQLSFGDVTTMFSSRHYQLILMFKSNVAKMNNGRPDKSIASCFGESGPDKKRTVYVDAPTSAVKNVNDPAITSQLPQSILDPLRPPELKRAITTGGVGMPGSEPPKRVKLQLQLEPSLRDENEKVIRAWWQYAYSTALYEVRKRRTEEARFDRKYLQFDWEKESYKRKEYVDLYIATRLEPSSVLRTMELKVKLGTNSPQEALLKIEDELPAEQILLYRSIARSVRVRGMRKMPDSVLNLHSEQWVKECLDASPSRKKESSYSVPSDEESEAQDEFKDAASFIEVETDCLDINGIRGEADAVRMRTNISGSLLGRVPAKKNKLKGANKDEAVETAAQDIPNRISSERVRFKNKDTPTKSNGGGASDSRTVRSFKTAKTSQTKATGVGKRKESSGMLRISASITFSKIELMVYRERTATANSIDSMRFRPAYSGLSSGVLDTKIRSSVGLQVVTNDASYSDVSDVSILSDDQLFFDQNEEALSMADDESVGDVPIMSSTDFLRFGLPRDIVLHATVSGLVGSTRGLSGGQQILSLSIENVSIVGENDSPLLSLKPANADLKRPLEEVHVDKKKKKTPSKKNTAVSFSELEIFQDQAVLISVASKKTGKHRQCDLSKTVVTCDIRAALQIYEFFADVQVTSPQPLITPTEASKLRKYVLRLLSAERQALNATDQGVSNALRLHGFEVVVPGPCNNDNDDDDSLSREPSRSTPDSQISSNSGTKVTLFTNLIEYYDGSLLGDILSVSGDFMEAGSLISNEVPLHTSDKSLHRRHLTMTNVSKVTNRHPSSNHSVITLTGISCEVSGPMGENTAALRSYKILNHPVDVEMLLTKNDSANFLSPRPRKQLCVDVSPIRILLSEARVVILSKVANSLRSPKIGSSSGSTKSTPEDATAPRLAALSIQILYALELRLSSLSLVCVEEIEDIRPSEPVREIIMEESLSDFVSVLSCFNLGNPTRESVEAAGNICVDRLVVLGLSADEAHDCVHAARLNFIAGIDAMKQSQSEVLRELGDSSQEVRHSNVSPDGMESERYFDDSASESIPSVNEISDDGTEESLDIIETTVKGAVEKTVSTFISLLTSSDPNSMAFSEVLVVEFPDGANLSVTKMFYDFRLECHFKSFRICNASGLRLVSLRCLHHYQPKLENDLHSSTTFGDSWAQDDGSSALSFSFFVLDAKYNFGEGGLPLAILGSHDTSIESTQSRQREQMSHIVIGHIELLFSYDIIANAIDSVSRLTSSFRSGSDANEKQRQNGDLSKDRKETKVFTLYVVASSLTATLTSDELVPFCQLEAKDITVDNSLPSDGSTKRPRLNVMASALNMLDLTPEGYGYSNVLSPLTEGAPCSSFTLRFSRSPDRWKEPTKLEIELSGVRLFFLRRFLNEIAQYMVSKDHGIGRLLDKIGFSQVIFDAKGNPPPPLQYIVTVVDSSVILPRCSTSIDMMALEVEKITVSNGSAASSFEMPTAVSGLKVPPDIVYGSRLLKPHLSSSFGAESEFFDCVDSDGSIEASTVLSSFKRVWIKRTTVLLEKIRIYSSLPSRSLPSRGLEDPLIHKFYKLNGRAAEGGRVYAKRPEIVKTRKIPLRYWREITASKCSLEIIADSVPHLRLLISDRVIRREECSEICSMNLDLRQSDFCLLLSVWFSNMQELPVMFPYDPAVIETVATATKPSVKVPEYGTDMYVKRLKNPSAMKSEVALVVDALRIRGSFDDPGYFAEVPQSLERYAPGEGSFENRTGDGRLPFTLALGDCVLSLATDTDGILRLGCGAWRFEVKDERRVSEFEDVFLLGDQTREPSLDSDTDDGSSGVDEHIPSTERRAWADLAWGLDCNGRTFSCDLPQPFQASVFMTPGWTLTNLGFEGADAILTDLSPIWILVDFFASYFKSGAYGNPTFEAAERKDDLKRELKGDAAKDTDTKQASANLDFRLWLLHPCICVPESLAVKAAPSVTIDCSTGFFYHYRSIEACSLQEMGSTDLSLRFSEVFHLPSVCRNEVVERETRTLIEGLSFFLRFNSNAETRHTSYGFRMPMFDPQAHDDNVICSVVAPEYDIKPITLHPPKICIPFVDPTRHMGPVISEMTLFLESLPVALSLLHNLVAGPTDTPPPAEIPANLSNDGRDSEIVPSTVNLEAEGSSVDVVAHIDSFRIFAIDPILEKHLPVASLCLSPLEVNVSQLSPDNDEAVANGEAYPDDLQVTAKFLVWADYFKLGTTRSWEPFLEPLHCLVLYERSKRRGQGLSLNSDDAFHLNITGSLLLTLDENIRSFTRAISEIIGDKDGKEQPIIGPETAKEVPAACVDDELFTKDGATLNIRHEIPKPIPTDGRTAFSFRNLTGQKIRIHQLADVGTGDSRTSRSVVAYLDHHETTTLSFDATISVIRNLGIEEVPFPGLQNSNRIDRGVSLVDHEVDMQLPGFRWLSGISVNTSGRKFDSLVPVSAKVLEKVQQDWRLQNTMKVLTEVGVENGGRLIAARSLFEVRNKTSHSVLLNFNPDPTECPSVASPTSVSSDADQLVKPGASFQIPSLLIETSLELEGHHLGSFWIRPFDSKENKDLSYLSSQCEDSDRESVVEYSSRPIQLAKLVHESALIFKSNGGEDLEPEKVRSGVQISCPAVSTREGTPLAPFCYVVEARRSPLVRSTENLEPATSPAATPKQEVNAPGVKHIERTLAARFHAPKDSSKFIHGPVSYSLLIHPPLVIENLLPKRGRFELMHATRRTVLWFGDLNPGDRIPIHTVGLDAPLLLMVNLGFCRTPVGEGALVHHGADSTHTKGLYNISHGGLKSIGRAAGKAVTKGTKQFAKAATAIAESPDKRGQGKLFLVQNPQFSGFKGSSKLKKVKAGVHVEGNPLGIDSGTNTSDGKIHGIEHESFDPTDVVNETVVVDSVGQRLTLNIENVRGGGGQRRISLYCPLWIVNTTEHSLIYKQEKGSSFVSGTVVSPSKDGSRPVDDSDRNFIKDGNGNISRGPVHELRPSDPRDDTRARGAFAGTPGALATRPGCRPLSSEGIISLLDKDLPLKALTDVAFMFNFQLDILTIFKLCVQLSDGTGDSQYSSAWSQGFSLDSVGVNQIVSMPCKDGRALEVSMTLSVAPGLLSGYTKIVRFAPRFVLVNYLERPVRIWQDSSLLHPLYEGLDRPSATSDSKRSKWHFKDEDDPTDAVNQYEYLFGRSATLDERNIDGITAGTTASKSALYIATAGKSAVIPFHLPDTRGERQLRIDLGGSWNLSSSFSADATGDNLFKITRAVDSRLLSHVTTRASPQYRVILPPQDSDDIDSWDGELGVWFETDWGGDRRIIVQGIKRESYAFNFTDIHIGDELLRVDDFNVSQMTFQETMKVLKEKLAFSNVDRKNNRPRLRASAMILRRSKRSSHGEDMTRSLHSTQTKVVLTFRTLEERLRRVRIKALKARRVNAARKGDSIPEVPTPGAEELGTFDPSSSRSEQMSFTAIQVDMRMLQNTAFVVVRQPDMGAPPFRIENRAMDRIVFFRQRSCSSYPWNQVMPGESLAYTWEEPLRARKLVVRVGPSSSIVPLDGGQIHADFSSNDGRADRLDEKKLIHSKRLKQLLSAQYVENEEEGGLGASVTVKLEVIGFTDVLPYPRSGDGSETNPEDEKHLNCYVDTDGMTRVLIITDRKENEDERTDIENHVTFLQEQIKEEESRKARIQDLQHYARRKEETQSLSTRTDEELDEMKDEIGPLPLDDSSTIDAELQYLTELPEDTSITRCHQVYVEVIEAAGLRSSDASGTCNPYCEVALKENSKSRKTLFSKQTERRITYYVENTTTPKWSTQSFVYDISPKAVHATRGYAVRVRLRNFHWIGHHPNLGQTTVYLSTLRNQQELVGWYPLVGTKERSDVDDSSGSYSRGSVKLRLQWVYTVPGLLDYFLMMSERRLSTLRHSVEGMEEQLSHAIETQKTREQYVDTLGSLPIPMALSNRAKRKAKLSASGHIRRESRGSASDRPTRKLPRASVVFRMRDNLRKSRSMHLLQLDSQTSESRRRRLSASDVRMSELEPIERRIDGEAMQLNSSIPRKRVPGSSTDGQNESLSFGSRSVGDSDGSGDSKAVNDPGGAGHDSSQIQSQGQSHCVPDPTISTKSAVDFRDDNSSLLNSDIREFSRLARSHSYEGATSDGHDSIVYNVKGSLSSSTDQVWQSQREETMDILLQRGFIHHDGDAAGVYNNHLAYHVRPILVDSSSGIDTHSSTQNFRAKSTLRLSPVIREFRSWTAAQAVFNDDELKADIVDNSFLIELKNTPGSPQNNDGRMSFDLYSFEGGESSNSMGSREMQLRLPRSMPPAMRSRAVRHSDEMAESRNQFESACKRSLRAVLNPGGWLTIRPMTALYLPETCAGMFVKLRYGAEVVVSETVDAKVSPTWTVDTTVQVTPYAHVVASPGKKKGVFEYGASDLQVFIDPQRTSGSLRLSVIGERMNKSKVELGVLHIPLGAAINCCVECMEEIQQERERHKSLLGPGIPAYVRWFPLMNPKEAVAVDGDLGHSGRPFESEQVRDNMFVQYFTPCIKLAFIWQPNEEDDDADTRKRTPGTADSLVRPEQLAVVAETYCNADIGRFSFALIDSQRAVELVSLYVTDIDVRYSVTMAKTRTGLFLGCIQIDYQDDNAREPVVLAPTPGDSSQPTLQFVAVKDNLRSKSNITSYEYVWFSLQEMDLTLEESWMFELWDFFISIVRRVEARNMSTFGSRVLSSDANQATDWAVLARSTPRGSLIEEHTTELKLGALLEENEPTNSGGKKMYVGQLVLDGVRVNLSYLKGKRQNWEVKERGNLTLRDGGGTLNMTGITIGAGGMIVGRDHGDYLSPTYQKWSERTQDEEMWNEAEVKYSNLPKTIAAVFPSVSDAPIRLQGKVIEHVFESPDEIVNSIKSYYKDTILSQIYKIIGALDFVGNPSMLFSSFFSGVRDFFLTPSQAFLRTPNDPSRVGIGVAKGTLSLFSHSTSGVFGFISKMSASAGQVVAVLSLDDEFKKWHSDVIVAEAKGLNRQWKRRGVQSVPTMVARPLYDVIRGVVLGVTGIVVNPYVGAKRRGCPGFAKGVAAGTVGVIAKPVTGVLDAFSHASGSVYDMAKSVNVLEKRYLPPKKLRLSYSFGPKGVLMPFDQVTARSVYLLETHPMKVSYDRAENIVAMGNEIHVASEVLPMEPGVETYVVASSHRVVLFQVKKESGGDLSTNMRWQVDLTRASSVSCKLQDQGHNGIALIISTTVPKKKVRIAGKNQDQSSPEKRTSAPNTPAGVSQASLHDSVDEVSAPYYPAINDEEGSEFLEGSAGDNEKEGDPDSKQDGEVLEWYSIRAEYQQGRQLNRIHNAICCIIGDFDGISSYRSGNNIASTDGYTSFGELFFGEKPLHDALVTTPRYDREVCEDLNMLPWMYGSMFQRFAGIAPEKQRKMLLDMRGAWLFSREVSAVLKDGTPTSLVDTRARAAFIPHSPPALPANIEAGDEVVSDILLELKQGNISYDQACDLIESHAQSILVCPPSEESSVVSSVTEGHDVPDDHLFRSALSNSQAEQDIFHSAKQNYSSIRTPPSETGFFVGVDAWSQSAASEPVDFYPSRSSLPFIDAMNSSELQSLAEKSMDFQSLAGRSLKSAPLPDANSLAQIGTSTASLSVNALRDEKLSATHGRAPLRRRTESAPPSLVVPKSPQPLSRVPETDRASQPPPSTVYDSWVSQPGTVPNQSRLSRMESMLEQLIIMNARSLAHQDGYSTGRNKEEPEMIALRQEIADLRAQVHEATSDGSRREMIAALRKEVKALKEELKLEKDGKKNGGGEASHVDSHVEGDESTLASTRASGVGATFDEQLQKVRPAAVKFARGLEHGGASMARRMRKGVVSDLEIDTTIPEEDEDKGEEAPKDSASV